MLAPGDTAPDFTLPDQNGDDVSSCTTSAPRRCALATEPSVEPEST